MYCISVYTHCYTNLFVVWGWGLVSLLPMGGVCQVSGVWDFYLRGGACHGYDNYLAWGLCVFEPFAEMQILWVFYYGYVYYLC